MKSRDCSFTSETSPCHTTICSGQGTRTVGTVHDPTFGAMHMQKQLMDQILESINLVFLKQPITTCTICNESKLVGDPIMIHKPVLSGSHLVLVNLVGRHFFFKKR